MDMGEYQRQAMATAVYPEAGEGTTQSLAYLALKLNGEAGEVAELIGKHLRGDDGPPGHEITSDRRAKLLKELGDVQWYVANLAAELGFPMSLVCQTNLNKLAERKSAGTLKGSGSDR